MGVGCLVSKVWVRIIVATETRVEVCEILKKQGPCIQMNLKKTRLYARLFLNAHFSHWAGAHDNVTSIVPTKLVTLSHQQHVKVNSQTSCANSFYRKHLTLMLTTHYEYYSSFSFSQWRVY